MALDGITRLYITRNPSSEGDLHSEFGRLTTLLTLVTAINNKGNPTLEREFSDGYKDVFDTCLPEASSMIHALSSILVRDYRDVAVALPNSQYHPSSSSGHSSVLQVYVMQDDDLQFENMVVRDYGVAALTPIENAGTKEYRETSGNIVITKGTSHFDLISNDNWKCLTIP
jgi:hypothetical protein